MVFELFKFIYFQVNAFLNLLSREESSQGNKKAQEALTHVKLVLLDEGYDVIFQRNEVPKLFILLHRHILHHLLQHHLLLHEKDLIFIKGPHIHIPYICPHRHNKTDTCIYKSYDHILHFFIPRICSQDIAYTLPLLQRS